MLSLFRRLFWIAVAYPTVICVAFPTFILICVSFPTVICVSFSTLLVDIRRLSDGYEGYFLKQILLQSKIFCRLSDALHLSDGYISVA